MQREARQRANLLARLRRIEGQVRGIARMVEEDQYCIDILHQVTAVRAALQRVGAIILEGHLRGCVTEAIRGEGGDAAIAELMEAILKFEGIGGALANGDEDEDDAQA